MKPVFPLFLSLCLALGLSSCVTAPKSARHRLNVKIPDGWAAYASSKPIADTAWIGSFGDQQLLKLVDEALEHNKDLKVTSARIRSAEATAVIAGAALTPRANVELDGGRSQRNFIGFPFGAGGQQVVNSSLSNNFGLRLSASWEVDIWGRIRAAKSAALADLQASESDYEAAQLSIAAQTARSWFTLLATHEQLELAEEDLESAADNVKTIENAIEFGQAGSASELEQARATEDSLLAVVQLRNEQVVRLRKQIDIVLGRYPAGELAGAGGLPKMPGRPPTGVPADLLDRRPDVRTAERRLAAADKRVLEAKRSLLPQFNITGNYGTGTPDLEEILNSDFTVWSFASGVTQPILEGRRLRETVKIRQANSESELAGYQQTVLIAFREVEEALASEEFQRKRVEAYRDAAEHGQKAVDRARDAVGDGEDGAINSLLRAQERLIGARAALVDARRDWLTNRIDLHTALGGDFRARD
ncbi:MAG: multidrug efflux system outer membrane protein [Verrucomicrobiales bacterium]|jgi:multidrug efflux system outer membrane protein